MSAIILIACVVAGFKIGQAVIRIGRALNVAGFASSEGRILFSVNN
jgi:hypothetical protein